MACAARCNARAPRAGRRGGSAVARRRQGVAGEHRLGPREAPGKKSGDGAHRGGRAMVGQREVAGVAAFNSGGIALVVVDEGGWCHTRF
jgi:hypothetical protein